MGRGESQRVGGESRLETLLLDSRGGHEEITKRAEGESAGGQEQSHEENEEGMQEESHKYRTG
jgi:hypothetical protein